ncbi:MAG TPA: class I SAM-dependent methyltransferase [Candidatus Competibacteraceae bacterium]|nr:class I SAM-dependent methyltransferase [Candidatus Competibacteraceae bacterium]
MSAATTTEQTLARYYRLHARLYDATRWSFLFGRSDLQARIAALRSPQRILEIGCGTGRNLARLAHCFPAAQLIGLDLSADMLARARTHLRQHRSRVILRQQIYSQPLAPAPGFDLIVLSYCLSMINPGWEQVIRSARQDLMADGLMAVVDFHDTRWPAFRRWMAVNHVRMEGQLLPELQTHFQPLDSAVRRAYGGAWRYLRFIGTPRPIVHR